MGDIQKFAALNTKIRVLERELLKDEDYIKLIKLNNISDIMQYFINNTAYNKFFKRVDINDYDLSALEGLFYKNLLRKYDKITNFLHLDYKKLFKKLFVRYEVENLKVYVRRIVSKKSVKDLYKKYSEMKYANIDYKKLSDSNSFDELIENLKGTNYYEILEYYKESDNKIFYIEMSLDIYYFNQLTKEVKKRYSTSKENTILEILEKNIDLLNIQWIYRGLKNYKLSPEELLNYVILSGYYFKYEKLKKLCYSKNINELVQEIKGSKYGFLFDEDEDFELLMERNLERYIYNLFKKIEKVSTMNINKSISYMHKLEYEMRDVFTIMAGVQYKIEEKELKKMLVRKLERG